MKAVKIRSLPKLHALLLLQKPCHGYELMKDAALGKRLSPGEIYPFLKNLKRLGYLEIKKTGSRDKKSYMLTPKGRIFMHNVLQQLDSFFLAALKPRLSSCAHCGCKIYDSGYKKGKRIYCCIYCSRGG